MASIESILTETRVFPPADAFVKQANVSGMAGYQALCRQAETDYEGFWADQGSGLGATPVAEAQRMLEVPDLSTLMRLMREAGVLHQTDDSHRLT